MSRTPDQSQTRQDDRSSKIMETAASVQQGESRCNSRPTASPSQHRRALLPPMPFSASRQYHAHRTRPAVATAPRERSAQVLHQQLDPPVRSAQEVLPTVLRMRQSPLRMQAAQVRSTLPQDLWLLRVAEPISSYPPLYAALAIE